MIGFQLEHTHTHKHTRTHTHTHTHTYTHTESTLAAPSGTVNSSEQAELGPCQVSESSSSPLVVVDSVSKPRRVYDGELELDSFLFDVYCVFDDLHGLVNTL